MTSLKRWIHKLKTRLIIKLGGCVMAPVQPKVIIQTMKTDVLKAVRRVTREEFQLYPRELLEKEIFDELSEELIKQTDFKFNEEHGCIRCEATIYVARKTEDMKRVEQEVIGEKAV